MNFFVVYFPLFKTMMKNYVVFPCEKCNNFPRESKTVENCGKISTKKNVFPTKL